MQEAYEHDLVPNDILEALDRGDSRHKDITLGDCTRKGQFLYYRDRLYIPDHDELRARLLREAHELPIAGHPGRTKTYDLLQRNFYWPGMYDYVRTWVKNCQVCRRITSYRNSY